MGTVKRPHIHQKSGTGTMLSLIGHVVNLAICLTVASKVTIFAGVKWKISSDWTLLFALTGVILVGGLMFWLMNGIRGWLLRYHRMGWRLMEEGKFAEAIPEFEKSHDWFTRHPWLDNMRGLVLLDPSGIRCRESALLNIAHCHDLLENSPAAESGYRRVLEEFPDSQVAPLSLHWRGQLSGTNPSDAKTPDDSRLGTVQCSQPTSFGIGLLLGVPIGVSLFDIAKPPAHGLEWAVAGGLCLVLFISARVLFLKQFQQGMQLLRGGSYPEAIAAFEAQDNLVARHPWIDRFRAVIFLWASPMGLREISQVNIGLCYVRMGDPERARAQYEKVQESFPRNVLAHDALRIMRGMAA